MPANSVPGRILLLEDEPIICKVVTRMLKAEELDIDVANNGLIAKEKIEAGNEYDLFIFDIRTPVIDGMQLFEFLEKEYPELTQKVIFATGDCLNAATSAFLERVKRPFLVKPYTPDQIKSLMRQVYNWESPLVEITRIN